MSHNYSPTNPPEKQQSLSEWLEPGILHLREAADIPKSLISDQTVQRTCEVAPDDLLIKTAKYLGLADTPFFNQAISTYPDLNITLVTAEAQNIMRPRITEQQPALILGALAKVVAKLTGSMAEGTLQDPGRIVRVLLVLASVCFCSSGEELFPQFATALNSHESHRMIERFGIIAIKGEHEIIDKMDRIIFSNSRWGDWALWFMEQAESLAPQCRGALVASRHSGDSSRWNVMWDTLLNRKEEPNGN